MQILTDSFPTALTPFLATHLGINAVVHLSYFSVRNGLPMEAKPTAAGMSTWFTRIPAAFMLRLTHYSLCSLPQSTNTRERVGGQLKVKANSSRRFVWSFGHLELQISISTFTSASPSMALERTWTFWSNLGGIRLASIALLPAGLCLVMPGLLMKPLGRLRSTHTSVYILELY